MYKQGSFEDEIYRSMEKTLVNNQVEEIHKIQRLAKAVDFLNSAAEIFDQAGRQEESLQITAILRSLAKDFSNE